MATYIDQRDAARPATTADGAVRAWLWLVVALIVAMITVGGATRLTDSGLSMWNVVTCGAQMRARAWVLLLL